MHNLDNDAADSLARQLAVAVESACTGAGRHSPVTFVCDPREDDCDIAATCTLVLPECFGPGDMEAAVLAFYTTYVRSAQANADVIAEAEAITANGY